MILKPISGTRAQVNSMDSAGKRLPFPLANQSTLAASVIISGVRRFRDAQDANGSLGTPVNNIGKAFAGFRADAQPMEIEIGKEISVEAPDGDLIDLADVWIVCNQDGDGVFFTAFVPA